MQGKKHCCWSCANLSNARNSALCSERGPTPIIDHYRKHVHPGRLNLLISSPGLSRTHLTLRQARTARAITTYSGVCLRRFNCAAPECPLPSGPLRPSRRFHPLFPAAGPNHFLFRASKDPTRRRPVPSTAISRAGLIIAVISIAQRQPQNPCGARALVYTAHFDLSFSLPCSPSPAQPSSIIIPPPGLWLNFPWRWNFFF